MTKTLDSQLAVRLLAESDDLLKRFHQASETIDSAGRMATVLNAESKRYREVLDSYTAKVREDVRQGIQADAQKTAVALRQKQAETMRKAAEDAFAKVALDQLEAIGQKNEQLAQRSEAATARQTGALGKVDARIRKMESVQRWAVASTFGAAFVGTIMGAALVSLIAR